MTSLVYLLFNKLDSSTLYTGSKIFSMAILFSAQNSGWVGNSWLKPGLVRKWVRSKEVSHVAGEQESYMGKESGRTLSSLI